MDFVNDYIPNNNMTIITCKSSEKSSKFSTIETTGLPSNYKVNLAYYKNEIKLLIKKSDTNNNIFIFKL